MYYCLYYWLIAPLRGGVVDTSDRKAAFALTVHALDAKEYEVSLFCDPQGHPEFARCRIAGLPEKAIPESLLPLLQSIREHLLSSLRLTFRPDVMFAVPSTVWSFFPEGQPYGVNVLIEEFGSAAYSPERTKDIFVHSYNIRELMRLFVDGVDARIPLQYRYLSFYKLIENRFRNQANWDRSALTDFLRPYAQSFSDLGFKGTPASVLHALRDKCAHIKTGSREGREVLGVTHLNHGEVVRIESILPHLRAICAQIINERTDGKFIMNTEIVHEGPRPMASNV
jgi:hypothetical protein